jgi:hypothetical protein
MAIIEEAVKEPKPARRFNIDEFRARIRALGLNSPDESAAIIRADRDAGHRDH